MNPSPAPSPTYEAAPDAELLSLVRDGQVDAYAELYRRHYDAAVGFATGIAGRSRAEDVTADAFARILNLLGRGGGPEIAFRAYLLTTIRNTHTNVVRKDGRVIVIDDLEGIAELEPTEPAADTWSGIAENRLVADALATLPPRWQEVIRLTTIEEKPLDQVAAALGCSQGAAAQLAFRAREALRVAYLAQHVTEPSTDDCRTTIPLLARHARGTSVTRQARVESHLGGCAPCRSARTEIVAVAGRMWACGPT